MLAMRILFDGIRSRKMEMAIDEHIAQLKKLKSFHNGSYGASINFAIDVMHKYQKIQEIYSDYLKYMNPDNLADRIGEILEDGNN